MLGIELFSWRKKTEPQTPQEPQKYSTKIYSFEVDAPSQGLPDRKLEFSLAATASCNKNGGWDVTYLKNQKLFRHARFRMSAREEYIGKNIKELADALCFLQLEEPKYQARADAAKAAAKASTLSQHEGAIPGERFTEVKEPDLPHFTIGLAALGSLSAA